jgi:phosphoribosyl-ATP pyrophosphohydrolase
VFSDGVAVRLLVFDNSIDPRMSRPLDQLEATIAARKSAGDADSSYTAKLLAGGVEKIGKKIVEEAAEVVEAAGEPGEAGREHTIAEAGDVLYHLMVLLAHRDIQLEEVERELARRFGMSGIEEKASRGE